MTRKGLICLLVITACGSLPALAVNPNEATGFPTDSVMLVDGPGGDSISAFNGSLELGIPIGPTWELPGMSWGLRLQYSAKLWRVQEQLQNDNTLIRRGPFGLGWMLSMGRIYKPCQTGYCPGQDEMSYEDQAGTLHPIKFEGPRDGNILRGMTTDGTFMRAERFYEDPNSATVVGYRLYPGNGLVLIFESHYALAGWPSESFSGWTLTRMEKHGPDPNVIYSWVEVDYETDTSLGHCIKEIRDGVGSDPNTALRTITFTNSSVHDVAAGGTAAYLGGYTEQITMPAVVGQSPATATYTFVYEDLRDLEWDPGDPNDLGSHENQLFLSRIELPSGPNDAYTFGYDPGKGELTSRTLLTGAEIQYRYDTHGYTPGSGVGVFLREVVKKCLGDCDLQATPKWTYNRVRPNIEGPVSATVVNPFGNTSEYFFFDSSWFSTYPWLYGRTKTIYHFSGAKFINGSLAPDTTKITYEYENVGTDLDPDIRLVETSTNYPREITVRHSDPKDYGHYGTTVEWGPDGSETDYERKIIRDFYHPEDPNLPSAWHDNWVTGALKSQTISGPAGSSGCLRYSEFTYLADGKIDTASRFNGCGTANERIKSRSDYEAGTGRLRMTTLWQEDSSGAQFGPIYQTGYEYDASGLYLLKKRTYDTTDPNVDGTPFSWASYHVERDSTTGTVLRQFDPQGNVTSLQYDILGRPTRTEPASPEEPIETIYTSFTETTTRRGPATGDRIEKTTYLDGFGKVVAETRVVDPNTVVMKSSCYDVAGRPVFVSEWREPQTGESFTSPFCPDPDNPAGTDPDGTYFDYRFAQSGSMVTDHRGRLHKMTAADGSLRTVAYSGLNSTVTGHNLNNEPSTGQGPSPATTFARDHMGRLTFVDPPQGADARYTYNAMGELELVELLEDPDFGLPFIQPRTFQYDKLGRLTTATNPESGTVLYTSYDAAGNVLEKIESDGTCFRMDYDAAGRLLTVHSAPEESAGACPASGWTLLAKYIYDTNAAGRLGKVNSYDDSGTLVATRAMHYDGLNGRMDREITSFPLWDGVTGQSAADPDFTTCYSYNDRGLLGSLRYPADLLCTQSSLDAATVDYHYDYGQLRRMNDSRRNPAPDPNDPATWRLIEDAQYNLAGGLEELRYGNDVVTHITPDVMYRPKQITVEYDGGGAPVTHLDTGEYKYDGLGNIIEIGADAYQYDFIGRLTEADVYDGADLYDLSYIYDDFGNMTQVDRTDPTGTTQKVFNVATHTNRISDMGDPGSPFLYDPRGNLRRDETQRYLFDQRNRLLAVKKDASAWMAGRYGYDAGGMRITKEDPVTGKRTFFVRDGSGNVLSEFVPSGAGLGAGFWQKDYFYALGRVIGHAEEERPRPVEALTSSTISSTLMGKTVTQPTLYWAPNEDPNLQGYLVYKKDPASGGWVLQTDVSSPVTTTSWTDPVWVPHGEARVYRVAALASGWEGVTSRGLRIEHGISLSSPSGFTAAARESSVTLTWTKIPEDDGGFTASPAKTLVGYNVYRQIDPGSANPWVLLNATPLRGTTRYDDLGVEEGVEYGYMLRTVDTHGVESTGQITASATPLQPPEAPAQVEAFSTGKAGEVLLRWWPSSEGDIVEYRVYHKGPGETSYTYLGAVSHPASEVVYAGFSEGDDHTLAVAAYDGLTESALSASAVATTRVSSPPPPMVTKYRGVMEWRSGTVEIEYQMSDPNDLWALDEFRLYRKRIDHDRDEWELMSVDERTPKIYDPNTTPTHTGRFLDPLPYRCGVTEYVIVGVTNGGDLTEDTFLYRTSTYVHPRAPQHTFLPSGDPNQPDKLRFDVQGMVYCAEQGNGWRVKSWNLLVIEDAVDHTQNHSVIIDPNLGWAEDVAPPAGEVWSYGLRATLESIYEWNGAGQPPTHETYLAEDICIDSSGAVQGDLACFDQDFSQGAPERPQCYPDCDDPPGTGGGGPDQFPISGPTGGLEPGTWWQEQPMRMQLSRPGRNVELREVPGEETLGLPSAQSEWRTAKLWEATTEGLGMRTSWALWGRGASMSSAGRVATAGASVLDPTDIDLPSTQGLRGADRRVSAEVAGASRSGETCAELKTFPKRRPDGTRLPEALGPPEWSAQGVRPPGPTITYFQRSAADDPQTSVSAPAGPPPAAAMFENVGGLNLLPMLITGTMEKGFEWRFYGFDHLRSIRAETDEVGTLRWTGKHLPYGESILPSAGQTAYPFHGFTGHERADKDQPQYMSARYYWSIINRFMSGDQLQGMSPEPQEWNRFTYVRNSPVSWADPTGLVRETRLTNCLACAGSWTAHNSSNGQNSDGKWNSSDQVLMTKTNTDGTFGGQTMVSPEQFLDMMSSLGIDGILPLGTPILAPEGFFDAIVQQAARDMVLLGRLIYAEAAGEPRVGMEAVGHVVKNRVESKRFPNSYEGVIYQKNAFEGVGGKLWNQAAHPENMSSTQNRAFSRANSAAVDVYHGFVEDPTGGSTFFHSGPLRSVPWFRRKVDDGVLRETVRIGGHTFYSE